MSANDICTRKLASANPSWLSNRAHICTPENSGSVLQHLQVGLGNFPVWEPVLDKAELDGPIV